MNIEDLMKSSNQERKKTFLDRHPKTGLYLSIIGLLVSIMALLMQWLK